MYNHKDTEKEILEYWDNSKIYDKVKDKNNGKESFYFCDGPPYATGQIHPGTGWNKTLKDSVCRYQRLIGKNVRAQPGYDTHGLPIEVKVEKELKFKNKADIEKFGIENFINKCKEFATKYVGIMGNQFKSLGIWMDYDNPYITYYDDYINSSWKTIAQANEKGLLSEGVYVLPYCYRCETTLANYELEYEDETDPSLYVKFPINEKEFLVIWTTTPWTLVANMGVMVHPTFQYVKAKVDEEIWIIAKERLDHLMEITGKSAVILEELPGRKLKDIEYIHPFQDKIGKQAIRKVVLSDEYVTLEDGSGLVHMAPGHGPEDFIVGKRFGIEPYCPVDGNGLYTEGHFIGKNVRAANPLIIDILKETGYLIYEARIKHRYPHCWRCKTPLIYITTNQWFITVSKLKDQMHNEIDKTEWHPEFAKERFKMFVTNAPDWCISRQRYWGIPLPIWKCDCGNKLVISSRDELPKIKELHRPYVDEIFLECNCGKKMKRIPDVLDVWFDSGNAIWAPLSEQDSKIFGEQADLILEGQDQIRGWFYSLLGSGLVRNGNCPYKRILMHGFFVDERGEKMSKSVGNFVPIEDILEKYGADSFRLWSISNSVWEELKFSWEEMKKASSDINIVLNMITFLERFHPDGKVENAELTILDKWMLSRLNSTIKVFRESFDNYELNRGAKALRFFITEDVSRFYMKLAKERISSKENSGGALYVLYRVMLSSLKMLSCICPMITEKLYLGFFKRFEKKESISLLDLEMADHNLINPLYEKQVETIKQIVSTGMIARQDAGIKLRWPIKTLFVETKSHEVQDAVSHFSETINALMNSKEVKLVEEKPSGEMISIAFEKGTVHVDKHIDESLYEEGIANEIKRRIQIQRKEAKLVESDSIMVIISSEKETEEIIKRNEKNILSETNSKGINFGLDDQMQEYTIDGRLVKISIKKH